MKGRLRLLTLFFCLSGSISMAAGQTRSQFTPSESYVQRVRRERDMISLSLRGAIVQALTNNLDIAIENYSREVVREHLIGTYGYYDPLFRFSTGINSSTTPTTSILQAGAGTAAENSSGFNFGPSVSQNIPGGGSITADFSNTRSTTNSAYSFVNPVFGSGLNLSLNQPLWRGFRQTATEHNIRILKLDDKVADSQFRQTVAEIIQRVHRQYWDLVFAIENHEVRRQSRELAVVQHDNTAQRVQSGLLTLVAATSARAEVALRDQELIQAEVDIVTAENALKQLIAPDPAARIWMQSIIPTDRPRVDDVPMTLETALQVALESRPEIDRYRLQLDKNRADRDFLEKETKPSVALTANFGSIGRSGTVFQPSAEETDSSSRVLLRDHPSFGAYPTSWAQVFGLDYKTWGVGLNIQVPIKNRTQTAQLSQTDIEKRRLMTETKRAQQEIIVEVRNAFQSIELHRRNVDAARLARELSEEQLRGETARFEVGFTTNFEVLRYQRDLADARVRELRALTQYQLAVTALEKATDTIVAANDVEIARKR